MKAIISGNKIARDITDVTGIQRSHVHNNLNQLVKRRLVEVEEGGRRRKKVYKISIQGFLRITDAKNRKLRDRIERGEEIVDKLEKLVTEELEQPPFKAAKPEIFHTTSEVHAKLVEFFDKCRDIVISTRAPFLWMGNFHGCEDPRPFPGTQIFWKTQMDFLEKSIEDHSYRLTYLVDTEGYINILKRRKTENERINCILAIIECIKGLDKGWNLAFVESPHEGLRLAQQAFALCGEEGYFVMAVVDSGDVVEKAIFFQSPTLAEFVLQAEAIKASRKTARSNLIKIVDSVMKEAVIPPRAKKGIAQSLTELKGKNI